MLPSLSDLPGGVALDRDGFTDSDAIGSYETEFEPEGLVFELGSSHVIGISTSVELQETELEAQGPVLFIRAAGPQLFGELAGASFAKVAGFTPENIVFEGLDVPQVGDAVAGLSMKIDTAVIDLEAYMLFFSRGQVIATVMVMGPAGKIALEDVADLAQLVNERIVQFSPP
jgi:hypothetical protein